MMLILVTLAMQSCKKNNDKYIPRFPINTDNSIFGTKEKIKLKKDNRSFTFRGEITLLKLSKMLVDDFNINLLFQAGLGKKILNINLNKVKIDDMFKIIGTSLNIYVSKHDNIYYLGALRDTDKSIYVAKYFGIGYEEMEKMLSKILENKADYNVFKNGVFVVRAQENSILNVKKSVDEIKELSSQLVRVQIRVYSMDRITNVDVFIKMLSEYDHSINYKSFLKSLTLSTPELENVRLKLEDEIIFYTELGKETKFINGTLFPIKEVTVVDNRSIESISYKSFGSETSIVLHKAKKGFLCTYKYVDTSVLEGGENPIFKNFEVHLNGIIKKGLKPIGYFKRTIINKARGIFRFKNRKEVKYFIVSINARS